MNLPYVISIPTYTDDRGSLSVVDHRFDLPFEIKRVFWVCTFPKMRGGHAHRTCRQALVAVAGQVVVSTWGEDLPRSTTLLDRPDRALLIPPGVFNSYSGTPGSVLLVLCSEPWDPDDEIEERSEL